MRQSEHSETSRGFALISFVDRYGKECEIQKSSLAEEHCLWVGLKGERMHLTQAQAAQLAAHLLHFAATGEP
jgi:hypothetical protein